MRRILFFVLLVSLSIAVQAQEDKTCPAIAEEAMQQLGDNCTDVDRNSACYGFDQVNTTFTQPIEPGFFTQPADITELNIVDLIETAPMNLATNQWGIAVMKVQADIPNTLPGQAVTFLLMGDARVQNAVPADEAALPVTVAATVAQEAVVLSEPDTNAMILGTVAEQTTLSVDALDSSGTWARINYLEGRAWVNLNDLEPDIALDTLPTGTRTPMQAFYFTTGVSAPACNEAPSVIAINTPDNLTINLNINGADVRLGSSLLLYNTAPDEAVYAVMEGQMEVLDTDIVVQAGQAVTATLDTETRTVQSWSEPEPMSADAVTKQQAAHNALGAVDIDVPLPGEVNAAGEVIHIVAVGETLFSIARLYDASMPAIVERNALDDPRTIRVGDRLIIPNPGSGFVVLEGLAPSTSPSTPAQPAGVCSGLVPTSPTSGLAYGINTFYWDGIPEADSYRLVVQNIGENRTLTSDTSLTSLTANIDQETLGGGFDFRWWVQALKGGEVICSSVQITLPRSSQASNTVQPVIPPVTNPVVPPPFIAQWACGAGNTVIISYSGAALNDTVQITYERRGLASTTTGSVVLNPPAQTGPSGSVVETYSEPSEFSNGSMTTTSGLSTTIQPALLTCP